MDINTLNTYRLEGGVDQLIERYVVTGSAVTSKTFSNLLGDTDLVYYIKARIVNGYAGATLYTVRLNNDSGTNYGHQYFFGLSTSAGAGRGTHTGILFANAASGNISCGELLLNAKSGVVRTIVNSYAESIAGTTITYIYEMGQSWNNTADQITSLVVLANQTNGIGIGSEISLWCRRATA